MAATDKLFTGSIPEIYDRFLVPLIFESYADDLAVKNRQAQTAAYTGNSRRNRRSHPSDGIETSCTRAYRGWPIKMQRANG